MIMSATATIQPPPSVRLITAEEFAAMPDDGRLTELVRGRIVDMPNPKPAHGYVCATVSLQFNLIVRAKKLGRVVSNDSGVITERDPDSMRGPDVAYYSFQTVPEGPLNQEYWPAPDLAFEVMSEHDRWSELTAKAGEYMRAGVKVVCILDPGEAVLAVYRPDQSPQRLGIEESLAIPELFPEWSVSVKALLS
jgi:Uma2 family endonuclease